jgi:hypothetical protein
VKKTSTLKYNPGTQKLTTPKITVTSATGDTLALFNANKEIVSHTNNDMLIIDGGD